MLEELDDLTVTPEEMNPKLNPDIKYFEQAIEAIGAANKFADLINE